MKKVCRDHNSWRKILGRVNVELDNSGMANFGSMNPFRRADWRWTVAERHQARLEPIARLNDPLIQDASRFIRTVANLGDTAAARQWPALSSAYSIYQAGSVVRDEIEARLLTTETFEVIAAKTGVSVSTIRAFEAIFYNVRDALKALDWLMTEVVRIIPGQPVSEGLVWKYLALAAGPALVDIMVDDYYKRPDHNGPQRGRWAAMGRFTVRELATDWGSEEAVRPLIQDGRRLFPHIYRARRACKDDPLRQVHREIIALAQASPSPSASVQLLHSPINNLPRVKPRKASSHGRRKEESLRPVALKA